MRYLFVAVVGLLFQAPLILCALFPGRWADRGTRAAHPDQCTWGHEALWWDDEPLLWTPPEADA